MVQEFKRSIAVCAAVVGLAGCAPTVPPAGLPEPPPLAGGWHASAVDPEARAAAAFAVRAMNRPEASLKSLDAVQSQVVAGLNYQLDLTLMDGSRWRMVVYRNLDGALSLTSSTPLR